MYPEMTKSYLPDQPILCCTPERIGPHGSRGNALHPVGVVTKHVDGFLDSQVMDVHFGVCSSRNEDPITRMRQKLWKADWSFRPGSALDSSHTALPLAEKEGHTITRQSILHSDPVSAGNCCSSLYNKLLQPESPPETMLRSQYATVQDDRSARLRKSKAFLVADYSYLQKAEQLLPCQKTQD